MFARRQLRKQLFSGGKVAFPRLSSGFRFVADFASTDSRALASDRLARAFANVVPKRPLLTHWMSPGKGAGATRFLLRRTRLPTAESDLAPVIMSKACRSSASGRPEPDAGRPAADRLSIQHRTGFGHEVPFARCVATTFRRQFHFASGRLGAGSQRHVIGNYLHGSAQGSRGVRLHVRIPSKASSEKTFASDWWSIGNFFGYEPFGG
jgi:hypothetical protein